MIEAVLAAAVGLVVGFVMARSFATEPAPEPPPAPEPEPVDGLIVRGVDGPRELWARMDDRWERLASSDGKHFAPWARDEDGEPDTYGFPPLLEWARTTRKEPRVRAVLEQWTEACIAASKVAWVLEIPTGDQLLMDWARRSTPAEDPGQAFARWLVGELGRAGRNGLHNRRTAEVRGPVARSVHRAAGALIAEVAPGFEVRTEPPPGVGPRNRETWLVAEDVAEALGNAPVAGVVHPLVVLRPVLTVADRVVLEGEVA